LSPGTDREFFFSLPRPDRLWGPPNLLSNGYQRFIPWGLKRPGREADNSPPSSASLNKPSWCGAQLKKSTRTSFNAFSTAKIIRCQWMGRQTG